MLELIVADMTCGHCASAISRAVRDVDAAVRCNVDLETKRVRIESSKPAADFLKAIAEAGYTSAESGTETSSRSRG